MAKGKGRPNPLDRAKPGNQHGITQVAGKRFGAYTRIWGRHVALTRGGR
jgi:hypothetical protein